MNLPIRKISENAAWQLIDRLSRIGVGFILFAVVARHLGPGAFGQLALALAIVSLVSPFATLSLDRLTIRDFAEKRHSDEEIFFNTLILRACGAALGVVMAIAVTVILYGETIIWLVAILSLVPLLQCFDVVDNYFQAHLNSRVITLGKLISLGVGAAFRIVLLCTTHDVGWFAFAFVFDAIALYVFLWCQSFRQIKLSLAKVNGGFIVGRFREAWPLMVSGFAYICYMRIPNLALGTHHNSLEISYYTVAMRVIDGVLTLVLVIGNSFYPVFVNLYRNSPDRYFELYERYCGAISLFCFFLALMGVALAKPFILLTFGTKFSPASEILQILMFGFWVMSVAVFRSGYLTIAGLQNNLMISALIGSALMWVLAPVLIHRWGAIGAAEAYVGVQFIVLIISDAFDRRTWKVLGIHLRSMSLLYPMSKIQWWK